MPSLAYTPLERLDVAAPVDRLAYLASRCAGKRVLDLGSLDETALVKQDTSEWLHGRLATVAQSVLGVDSSPLVPPEGMPTGPRSRIERGDVLALDAFAARDIDVIVAGELIEHLPNTLEFLRQLKRLFAGREFLATTPNATSLTNVLLASCRRESSHHDHLQVFSYKTLNTLCLRTGLSDWAILPYHVYYTEMRLRAGGVKGALVGAAERVINVCERLFPLLAGGLLLHVRQI